MQQVHDVLFLWETKLTMGEAQIMRSKLGFRNGVEVACEGRRGGLLLLWKEEVPVSLKSFSRYHIDVAIATDDGHSFRLTSFYGDLVTHIRDRGWQVLHSLHSANGDNPWIVLEDFKEILWGFEQQSKNRWPEGQMQKFRDLVDHCQLLDMGYLLGITGETGKGDANVKCRLDRVLANMAWSTLFPQSQVWHLIKNYSDHIPMLVDLNPCLQGSARRKIF